MSELRKLLEELVSDCMIIDFGDSAPRDKRIDQAISDIRKLMVSEELIIECIRNWHYKHYEEGLHKGTIDYAMYQELAKAIDELMMGRLK